MIVLFHGIIYNTTYSDLAVVVDFDNYKKTCTLLINN